MFAFGLIGYFMRKYGYPVAPAVLGLGLGDLAELSLRRSLLLNFGNPMILISRPLSVILLAGALVSIVLSHLQEAQVPRGSGLNTGFAP